MNPYERECEIKSAIYPVIPYLKSKNIQLKKTSSKDSVCIYFTQRNNLCYLQIQSAKYLKTESSNNPKYQIISGTDYNLYDYESNVMVFDTNGKVIIDLQKTSVQLLSSGLFFSNLPTLIQERTFLDDENMLIPIKGAAVYEDYFQHYRISNNKKELIRTIYPYQLGDGSFNCHQSFKRNGLILCGSTLYNFKTGKFLEHPVFDNILPPETKPQIIEDYIGNCFRYFDEEELHDLCQFIASEIKEKNLMIGYKEISVKKEDIEKSYYTFAYLDTNANIVSNLFYSNGQEIKETEVSNENYHLIVQELERDLYCQIDHNLKERVEKNTRLSITKKIIVPNQTKKV